MIDSKVFAELQNRGIITNVGLNPNDFKDIDELQNLGYATSIAADPVYDKLIEELVDVAAKKQAFLEAVKNGGTVTVDMDYSFESPIEISKNVEIDLNGYTLKSLVWDEDGESNSYVFRVKSGKLTITGKGEVVSSDAKYSMAVWVNGGDAEINGGVYKNDGVSCDLIYASNKGNIVINDGEFIATLIGDEPGTGNTRSALNIKNSNRNTCSIKVRGGKFLEFDPSNNVSEGNSTNFVDTGYESIKDGNYYIVKELLDVVVDDKSE